MIIIKEESPYEIFKEWIDFDCFGKALKEDSVGRERGFNLKIYDKDHYPPHLTVTKQKSGDSVARINLLTYNYMETPKDMSKSDQKALLKWAERHNQSNELTDKFPTLREGISVFFFRDKEKIIISSQSRLLLS